MISISTLPEVELPLELAEKYNILIETSSLIFIDKYENTVLDKIKKSTISQYFRSAHGPFFDLIPCTSDLELKDLIHRRFIKAIQWCEHLDINNVIFHSGWFPKTYPDKMWLENSISFWQNLMENTKDNINIFIENVYEDKPYLLKELIENINRNNLKICLDVGHVNANSSLSLEKWLYELGNRIGHLHIHNNNGKDDEHNGLKIGTIKYPEAFQLFQEHCPNAYWNLEIKTDINESIEMALKNK